MPGFLRDYQGEKQAFWFPHVLGLVAGGTGGSVILNIYPHFQATRMSRRLDLRSYVLPNALLVGTRDTSTVSVQNLFLSGHIIDDYDTATLEIH